MKLLVALVLCLAKCAYTIKIVAFCHNGLSHYKTMAILGGELSKRGHNFTLLQFNHTQRWPHINTHIMTTSIPEERFIQYKVKREHPLKVFLKMAHVFYVYFAMPENLAYAIANDTTAMQYLQESDLIMGEPLTFFPNLFSTMLKKPFIMVHSMTMRMHAESFRLPMGGGYAPGYNSFSSLPIPVHSKMVQYVLAHTVQAVFEHHFKKVFRKMEAHFNLTERIPQDRQAPLLINQYDPLFDYPLALHPNMFTAGVWLIEPTKPLPPQYSSFISLHPNGIIIVAFGTIFALHTDLKGSERRFINALSKHDFGVIISTKTKHKNLPSNVFIDSYIPQNDLLAHASVKLFVSHVGLLSLSETCYHGVPVLALPRSADQFDNSYRVEHYMGIGKVFSFEEDQFPAISDAIPTIINDTRIAQNVKRCSQVMHSKPLGYACEKVADFIEEFISWDYNASHLRPYVLDMPWYEYHMLDLLFTILALFFIPIIILNLCKSKQFA